MLHKIFSSSFDFWELLYAKGRDVKIVNGKLMAGAYTVNGDFSLPDRLKEICGGSATIFMDDERVSTNVLKEDGTRAIGARLQGPAYDAVVKDGKPYRGKTKILGVPYFTAYDPIKDASGKTIGVMYMGIKTSECLAAYSRLQWIILGLASMLVVAAALVNRFFIHRVFIPVNKLHYALITAEQEGDLRQRLDYTEKNEIGEMCVSFNSFMENLNSIVGKVVESA